MGKQGIRLGSLSIVLRKKYPDFLSAAYLLIHLGGNDITTTKNEELCAQIEHNICVIANRLPSCKLIWSDILTMDDPRRRGAITLVTIRCVAPTDC